ncbi:MAG: hypothetical protein R2875_08355 [Desulfobacterales bacterium]
MDRKEALSKVNCQNAVTFFTSHGLTEAEKDTDQIEFYSEVIQKYRRFLPVKTKTLKKSVQSLCERAVSHVLYANQ